MNFSQQFLDELKERIKLSDIISKYLKLVKKGKEFIALCPFHQEKTPSFSINDDKGFYHCFGCGAHGDAIEFLKKTENLSFLEVVKKLSYEYGLSIPVYNEENIKEKDILFGVLEEACNFFELQLSNSIHVKVYEYLKKRGISDDKISEFRLGFATSGNALKKHLIAKGFQEESLLKAGLLSENEATKDTYDRFRNRLIFPIFDSKKRVIAFGGRILGDGKPKYLNSPETLLFHKSNVLYALDLLKKHHSKKLPLLVTEGYIDVISLHQSGYNRTVAPLGTTISEKQIFMLWKVANNPIFCFDGDFAGQNAAKRVAERVLPILKPGYSIYFAMLPQGEDPDSLINRGDLGVFEDLIRKPISLFDFLWNLYVLRKNSSIPENQALIKKTAMNVLKRIKDSLVRERYMSLFNQRFNQTFGYLRKNLFFKKNFENIRSEFDSTSIQKKILLVTIINHPQILHDVIEQFVLLRFSSESMNNLCEEIIYMINEDKKLDSKSLKHHLYQVGYEHLLNNLLCRKVYIHAFFSKPDASAKDALIGWNDIWSYLYEYKNILRDIEATKKELSKNMNKNTWLQLSRLNQLIKEKKME